MLIDNDIVSERLVLKTLDESNVGSAYLSWMNNDEVIKYLEIKHTQPKSITDLVNFVNGINSDDKTLLLGIFLKKNNLHIGNIKLGPINSHHNRADIGFIIGDKKYWGQGYSTEAIGALVKFAFNEIGLQKLTAGCYEGNIGSAKALLKAGFIQEATLNSHVILGDKRANVFIFGIVL